MADTTVTNLTAGSALSGSDLLIAVQGGASRKVTVSQMAAYPGNGGIYNASTTSQSGGFASDTYLAGSSINIPAGIQTNTFYRCMFYATKTAAGTATPIISVRYGVNGTTSDSARCVLTFGAQTAAVDTATFEIDIFFQSVGSGTSAVLLGIGKISHALASTGFSTSNNGLTRTVGSGFDSTVANSKIGISVNGGTSAAWTIQPVRAELRNVA